jgi:hypothetical protein
MQGHKHENDPCLCCEKKEKTEEENDPCLCCEKKEKKEEEKDEEMGEKEPPAKEPPVAVHDEPDAAVVAVAAGTGAAAVANRAYEERPPPQVEYRYVNDDRRPPPQVEYRYVNDDIRPPTQVEYVKDDMSDDKSSIGVYTVPFYRSADVLEGDLFFDANTVA